MKTYKAKLYDKGEDMKKYAIFFMTVAMIFFANPMIASFPVYAEDKLLDIDEVIRNVDPEKINKAQFKEYFKDINGEKAKGGGIVIRILPSSQGLNRVAVLTPASNPGKGYNVVLYTIQPASAELKENDKVLFEGKITRVNPYEGASIDIHGTYQKAGAK